MRLPWRTPFRFDPAYRDEAMAALIRSLQRQGATADSALPALQGLYPRFGGHANVEQLFTRDRALTLTADSAAVWRRYSGNELGPLLTTMDRSAFQVINDNGRQYCRLLGKAGQSLWVHRRYAGVVNQWICEGRA